jgi:hypothetical protein
MTLEQCKQRALEYLDRGDLVNAVASMGSDLNKVENAPNDSALMVVGMMTAARGDSAGVRRWIEGFR